MRAASRAETGGQLRPRLAAACPGGRTTASRHSARMRSGSCQVGQAGQRLGREDEVELPSHSLAGGLAARTASVSDGV